MSHLTQKGKSLLSIRLLWKPITAVCIGAIIILVANVAGRATGSIADWWTNWADPVVTVATVTAAVFAWWETYSQAWEENLPKRLNVHYKYDRQYVFTCWEATLSGEDDIRQWAQQIGRQMNNNEYLDFSPHPWINSPVITTNESIGYFRLYEITINLTKPPRSEGYLVWEPAPAPKLLNDRRFSGRPTTPMHTDDPAPSQSTPVTTIAPEPSNDTLPTTDQSALPGDQR